MSEDINSILGITPNQQTVSPSSSPIGQRAMNRYRDAYLVARAMTGVGAFVKVFGFILGFIVLGAGLVISFQPERSSPYYVAAAFVLAALITIPFYVLGVLISAQGQLLKASIDTAVHTSPFLEVDQKATVTSLL